MQIISIHIWDGFDKGPPPHWIVSTHIYEVCGVKQLREAGQVRLTVCQIQRIVWQLLMIQYAAVPLDKCESFANELQLVKSNIELNWAWSL